MRRNPNEYQSWEMAELATLSPGHPGRAELERRLVAMSPENHKQWTAAIAEAEEIRERLDSDVALPASLAAKLARVPEFTPRQSRLKIALQQPIGLRHLAAVLLVGLGIAAYAMWPEPRPPAPALLGETLTAKLSELAIAAHLHPPSLELASDEPDKVQKALSAHDLPFSPSVLTAADGQAKLQGESVVQFAGTVAALTRWEHKGATWSLYQFSSKALDVPANFYLTERSVGEGKQRRHVSLWPGADGTCTWALVMEVGEEDCANPFVYYGGSCGTAPAPAP